MVIIQAKIHEVSLPLRKTFRTGFGDIDYKPELIIELITDDGVHGFGESPALLAPMYTSEFVEGSKIALKEFILPRILNKNFNSLQDFVESYSVIVGNNIAKSGVQCAFLHIIAQREKRSLKSLLRGSKSSIGVGETIDIQSNNTELIKRADQLIQKGFQSQ